MNLAVRRRLSPRLSRLTFGLLAAGMVLGLVRGVLPCWQQAQAIRLLEAAGGRVYCARTVPDWLRKGSLRQIGQACDRVVSVSLAPRPDSDPLALLDRIGEFRDLSELTISDARIHDADLWRLARLTQLRSLTLTRLPISGSGLSHLTGNAKLNALDLGATEVDDQGLKAVASFANLVELRLDHSRVTDAGMSHLRSLRHLRTLSLSGTGVLEVAVSELTNAIPMLEVSDD